MDRETIMNTFEPSEILIVMRLQKAVKEAVDNVVEKWVEAHEILEELYKANSSVEEKKVLDFLVQSGLTERDTELKKLGFCITRIENTLQTNTSEPSDESSEGEEKKEETAEEQGETSLEMWKRQKSELFDEEQLESCEWMPADTLEVAEMICLCENYFRTQFSRHKHDGGTLESLRIPMKDYIEYVKGNSLHQDNYPDQWVRRLMNQLVFEGWIFGRDSATEGWTMKPFSKGCIGFPKKMDEHPAVMQTGSVDLMQHCKAEE